MNLRVMNSTEGNSRRSKGFSRWRGAAFTLIEVMVAMMVFGLVVSAIYASWSAITKGRKVGVVAAETAQRERISMRMIEEALMSAQMHAENAPLYAFVAEPGSDGMLSFVSRLAQSFPRSGKFEGYDVRRVTFAIEPAPSETGYGNENRLVLRQNPLLLELDKDEQVNPIVLAHNVQDFQVEFWDMKIGDWTDEWLMTNQLPKLVKVYLKMGHESTRRGFRSMTYDEVTRIIGLPSTGVGAGWQGPTTPTQPAVPGRPNPGGQPPQPGGLNSGGRNLSLPGGPR